MVCCFWLHTRKLFSSLILFVREYVNCQKRTCRKYLTILFHIACTRRKINKAFQVWYSIYCMRKIGPSLGACRFTHFYGWNWQDRDIWSIIALEYFTTKSWNEHLDLAHISGVQCRWFYRYSVPTQRLTVSGNH